ncbi:hypothetical protein [Thioalkalivibrio sp. ALgr1]|uniref:hypothetical protein n=1 Tax=Thioalkalivibrio sp. ALgr1 TaxID=748655 RepID=UPI000365EE11|nr:hypothetical protein [Thioalkalivibrio sp. ALgr1]
MKLIIKEYLASLREREELDAVLPDLLSQMGMNVFSRPGRGTRQDGVDVAAVGSIDGEEETVYLFSIKPGDLRRADWNSASPQSLRPSLDEIQDAYIRNRLPKQHREKKIKICICIGGDIREEVRPDIEGYKDRHSNEQIFFEEWNGDRIASLIESYFLQEELLPEAVRSRLRKALALIDQADASYKHFSSLVDLILSDEIVKADQKIRATRQLSICLWILFAWAREQGNLESTYRAAELLLLRLWHLVRGYAEKRNNTAKSIQSVYTAVFNTYLSVGNEFLAKSVLQHASKIHGLSSAVNGSTTVDINLKLFDLVGRTALYGLWIRWHALNFPEGSEHQKALLDTFSTYAGTLKELVNNNPILLLPINDDQCIDVALGVLVLIMNDDKESIGGWLSQIIDRAVFAYRFNKPYPCNIRAYHELLEHPQPGETYRENATAGSILYPFISILAAMLDEQELYAEVEAFKREELQHCNFQYWYPNDTSEHHIYVNDEMHGANLSRIDVESATEDLLEQVFGECEKMREFWELSAVKYGFWPVVLTACRLYRLPVPLHLFREFWAPSKDEGAKSAPDA